MWQCLNDNVLDELRRAVCGTTAQLAWVRLTRDFFDDSGRGGGGRRGSRLRNLAVHHSRASLLSEFRLRVADNAMHVVTDMVAAAAAERRHFGAANKRIHQQTLEIATVGALPPSSPFIPQCNITGTVRPPCDPRAASRRGQHLVGTQQPDRPADQPAEDIA